MSRRGRGEGTIYPVRDGHGKVIYWQAQKDLGRVAGKRSRKTIRRSTRTEVAKALRELQSAADAGLTIRSDERLTLGEYLNRWLEAVGPSVRPRTLVMYRIAVKNHIAPELGRTRLTALTADQVQIFLNRKLESLSPKSVMNLRGTLRSALNQAMEWDYVSRNVVTKTRPPAAQPRKLRVLDQAEAKRLLEAGKDDRLYALYAVSVAMGLRLGEALGLQWQDIDWQTGKLHVQRGLQRIGGELTATPTKTEKSNRSVKMPALVLAALGEHQVRQRAEAIVTPWVFSTLRGTPIDPRNALRSFKGLLRKAGLPDIRFHDLRHTAATTLLIQGATYEEVAELLGHSDSAMLHKVYSHVTPHRRDALAGMMDEVLGI